MPSGLFEPKCGSGIFSRKGIRPYAQRIHIFIHRLTQMDTDYWGEKITGQRLVGIITDCWMMTFLGYWKTMLKSHAKTQRRNSRKLKIISRERNLLVEKWEESQSDSSVSWDSFMSNRINRSIEIWFFKIKISLFISPKRWRHKIQEVPIGSVYFSFFCFLLPNLGL